MDSLGGSTVGKVMERKLGRSGQWLCYTTVIPPLDRTRGFTLGMPGSKKGSCVIGFSAPRDRASWVPRTRGVQSWSHPTEVGCKCRAPPYRSRGVLSPVNRSRWKNARIWARWLRSRSLRGGRWWLGSRMLVTLRSCSCFHSL